MKSLAGMGDDDMAGFQDMMQSIVERNRRIAQERIDSLVNEFRLEADAVSRKLSSKIEKDYDGYSRSIHQRATARAQESKAIASKINNLAADYKSALRVAYDEFNSNNAAVADAARFDEELAALDAALASDVKKTIAKLDVKKRRVEADITAARRAVHERGGVIHAPRARSKHVASRPSPRLATPRPDAHDTVHAHDTCTRRIHHASHSRPRVPVHPRASPLPVRAASAVRETRGER